MRMVVARALALLGSLAVAGCDAGGPGGDAGAVAMDGAPDGALGLALDAQADGAPAVDLGDDAAEGADGGPPDAGDGSPDAIADGMVDGSVDGGSPPPGCRGPVTAGEDAWGEGDARARVVVGGSACARTFTLSTTAPLRDGRPDNPRVVADAVDGPVVRTGDPFFDGLHALAVEEAHQNAVDAIRDGAFRGGAPLPCPPGGCFETGRLWHYVWTRDTAYAVDLGLGALDPIRALNSLVFKTSAPRAGGLRRIVQDTGTGGSWPVSTDRVAWTFGARALLPWLEAEAASDFAALALEALTATARDDDAAVFDRATGLYRGEQSFLDWREQSYPDWVAGRPAQIALSAALGTNVAHYATRRWLAALNRDAGRPGEAAQWDAAADGLRGAIRARLYDPLDGLPSAFLMTTLDPTPARQFDLLGLTLAIQEGVLSPAEGRAALSRWPLLPGGPPVIWPQQQLTPIYHNRAQWPFVTAYWTRAAGLVRHGAALDEGVETLMRGAALNLSNMENFEAVSGRAWVDDGPYSGPVVNSQRQLWSVAGYLGMVHGVIFGLRIDDGRLFMAPRLTRTLRARRFGDRDHLALTGLRWRRRVLDIELRLPPVGEDGPDDVAQGYRVVGIRVDGRSIADPAEGIGLEALERGRRRIEVELAPDPWPAATLTRVADPGDWRAVFAPRSPVIEDLAWTGEALAITTSARDDGVRIELLRDGQVVAEDAPARWIDPDVGLDGQACFSARAVFLDTGLTSQHAEPRCWWGRDGRRVVVYGADALDVLEGERADEHGRPHVRDPGGAGVAVRRFVAQYDGLHAIQVVYGNGAGPVESGITCAVRRVDVIALDNEEVIGSGELALPHLGTWDRWADSTFAFVDLWASRAYRIQIHNSGIGNMSALSHFAEYTAGPGGVDGPFEAANIAAVKVLAIGPQGQQPAHEASGGAAP